MHYFCVAITSFQQSISELEEYLLYPLVSYVLPALSYIELLSPVLDAFEVDTQVALIIFSVTASLALLNLTVRALSYSLFTPRRSSDSDREDSLKSTVSDLSYGNQSQASSAPTSRKVFSDTLPSSGTKAN